MLQGLVDKAINENSRSVQFENRFLRKVEDVTSSPQPITRFTEPKFYNGYFIFAVSSIVNKKAEMAVKFEAMKEDRRRKFVEAA